MKYEREVGKVRETIYDGFVKNSSLRRKPEPTYFVYALDPGFRRGDDQEAFYEFIKFEGEKRGRRYWVSK